jgi:hypothetical protein
VTILKVIVGIDSSPAYLSPPAAGDPCNKVSPRQNSSPVRVLMFLLLAVARRSLKKP